ncbi:reverse transcriptase domain-containing protein [Tanacetum coccineum]
MTGVPRHLAEHRLNVREGCLTVRQKKISQAPERNKAIQEEVAKLVDARIMKEVHYHSWLSNPVMVNKRDGSKRGLLVEELKEKSINEEELLAVVEEEGDTWMTPIYNYLTQETLPVEKEKARGVRRKSRRYAVINGVLYKKSYLGPWLRCVGPLQANYVLRKIHEGSCNMHARTRSVVANAIRTGYYWPTMHADARKMIWECQDCQGIDIAGPFLEGHGKVKFLIVAIDYFTKWIEAKPVAIIRDNQIKKFVWDNIVCKFCLLEEIISDNGKQFRDNPFKDWCENLCICWHFASVKHPQANGLVERANKSLGEGIKARLDKRSKDWIKEILHVL